jgi:hypothetical protein
VFLIRLVLLPVRMAIGSLAVGYKAGSLLGYRRLLTFAFGVGVGLLVAPVPGSQLRERLRAVLTGEGPASDAVVTDRVRAELSSSPRTWHLPQPVVEAAAGTVTLRGEVPHDLGREELERTAAAVPGVLAVDNRLTVTPPVAEPVPNGPGATPAT